MKINKLFLKYAAWSWLVLGVLGTVVELWRPGFVDYLLPIWVPFSLAAVLGLLAL